ncbi:hypothetical protein GCM10025788_25720 [Serinicoccus chungangensis]
MLSESAKDRDGTWEARTKWLTATGIPSFRGAKWYQDFDALTQARNAMLHGYGDLTQRQTSSITHMVVLRDTITRRTKIEVVGTQLQLDPSNSPTWVEIVHNFIRELDALHEKSAVE